MNKILILAIGSVFFLSCNQKNKSTTELKNTGYKAEIETKKFDWLIGEWKRNNEEEGKETFENWKKVSKKEYSGIGFTMQKGDTIKQEIMKIIEFDGKWSLIVKVPEEKEFITFKMIEIGKEKFVVTNDSLDFPKQIEYWKNGNTLSALVSGGDLKIPFEFEKLDNF